MMMNKKFYEIPEEKQRRIVNAGLEVFGTNEYKRAVCDEIAAKAGISKGLLFYYFHNKHEFYMYLYHYCMDLVETMVDDSKFQEITDFFELMEYGAEKKMKLLLQYPYIMDFVMHAYYSQNESITEAVNRKTKDTLQNSFAHYFKYIDVHKFRDEVDPAYIYQLLVWMSDGYLHEIHMCHQKIDVEVMMKEFHRWEVMFRNMVYKEEFL